MSQLFDWPWCFSHNAPMLGTSEGWVCYRADEPTRDGSPGCIAITVHVRFVGTPFDLSTHPYWDKTRG